MSIESIHTQNQINQTNKSPPNWDRGIGGCSFSAWIFHQRPPEAKNLPTYGGFNIMVKPRFSDSIPYSSHNSQIVMGVIPYTYIKHQ